MRQLRLVADQERHATVADTHDQRSFWLTGQGIAGLGDQPWVAHRADHPGCRVGRPLSTVTHRQLPALPIDLHAGALPGLVGLHLHSTLKQIAGDHVGGLEDQRSDGQGRVGGGSKDSMQA